MMEGDGRFWLPPDFLGDSNFFLDGEDVPGTYRRRLGNLPSSDVGPNPPAADTESDEEDILAGLDRQNTTSFIQDLDTGKERTLSGSPQSTLCDLGIWSSPSKGGPSEDSTPPSTPLEQPKGDALDLLSAAAGEVARLQGRGILGAPSPSLLVPVGVGGFYLSSPLLVQQQMQDERVQCSQQQYPTARGRRRQNRGYKGGRVLAWPTIQRQPLPPQPGSGMRAVFLTGNGARKESAGTGVFLPRTPGNPAEIRRKPACSVLLPDRVIQALNLNLDGMGGAIHGRGLVPERSPATQHDHCAAPVSAAGCSQEPLRLPAEWTY